MPRGGGSRQPAHVRGVQRSDAVCPPHPVPRRPQLSANGKIPVANEQTNVPHIFAIGDIIDGDALSLGVIGAAVVAMGCNTSALACLNCLVADVTLLVFTSGTLTLTCAEATTFYGMLCSVYLTYYLMLHE